MPQRSRTRESDDVADLLDDVEPEESSSSESDAGFRSRAKRRAVDVFSPRFFLLAAVVSTVAMLLGGAFVPLGGSLAGLVSVFLASFVLGAVTNDSRVLETAAGGALGAGVAFLVQNLVLVALGGVPWAVVGAGAGFLAGALGAYFGGDLRDGLTREI